MLLKEIMDDDQEEEFIMTKFVKVRKEVSNVFKNRKNEGIFNNLINSHLIDEEERFQQYFRLTRERFSFVLNLIEEDVTTSSCNRVKEPITAAEKLALTMR